MKNLLLLLLILWAGQVSGQCVESNRFFEQPAMTHYRIQFQGNVPNNVKNAIRTGIQRWNDNSCNSEGSYGAEHGFPMLMESGGTASDPIVRVKYRTGPDPDNEARCGTYDPAQNEITMYRDAVANGNSVSCLSFSPGLLVDTAVHELGHALGLRESSGQTCKDRSMAPFRIQRGSYVDRRIKPEECAKIMETHHTNDEQSHENAYCLEPGAPHHDGYEYCSPIVIPLVPGARLAFTSPEDGVWFDLDEDGVLDRVGWTLEGEELALLWRDLDGNGVVDGGRELFGSVTPLLSGGVSWMGYEALAEFDALAFGGNGNGWADAGDYHWQSLQLWVDRNHDGQSQQREILTFAQAQVYALGILAEYHHQTDPWGNWPKLSAPAFVGNPGSGFTARSVDVYFVHGKH